MKHAIRLAKYINNIDLMNGSKLTALGQFCKSLYRGLSNMPIIVLQQLKELWDGNSAKIGLEYT